MKVYIDMDSGFRWWPVSATRDLSYLPEEYHQCIREREKPTMEVPDELVAEYTRISTEYSLMQEKLEQLYRIQRSLDPWPNTPIPDYKLLSA